MQCRVSKGEGASGLGLDPEAECLGGVRYCVAQGWMAYARAFLYQVYTIIALTDRDIDRDGEGIFG